MELLEMLDAPPRVDQTIRLRIRLDHLEHVAPELLEQFAAGSATPPERRVVVRHLLAGCPSCSRRLGSLVPLEHPQEMAAAYDEAFDRSLDHAFEALKLRHAEREDGSTASHPTTRSGTRSPDGWRS